MANIDPKYLAAILKNYPPAQSQQDYSYLDTRLSPEQEMNFQQWKSINAPNDSGVDYDLRGAFLDGMNRDAASGHFDDKFKKPNHPTFSTFSKFAQDFPENAGSWNGSSYIPPPLPSLYKLK